MIEHELLSLANNQEDSKLWVDAYNTYAQIYKDNDSDDVLEKLAWCASRADLYDVAIKHYMLLSEHKPQSAKILYNVGYQYYAQKKWADAIAWFEKALALYPGYFVVKYRLGYALRQLCGNNMVLKKDDFWKAMKQYSECEQLWEGMSPDNQKANENTFADVCYQKGKLLLERKQTSEAITYFERSLVLNASEDCAYQLSRAYFESGNIGKAKECLPKNLKAYYVIELEIDIFISSGKLSEAENLLKSLLLRRNKDYLHRRLSEVFLLQDNLKEAYKSISKAITLGSKNHINHYVFSKILFTAGLLNLSELESIKAIELKKEKYSVEYLEASALLKEIQEKKISENYFEDNPDIILSFKEEVAKENPTILLGKIESYKPDKGFGFIFSNGKKYFFHISKIPKNLQIKIESGLNVRFEEEKTSKGVSANNIELI